MPSKSPRPLMGVSLLQQVNSAQAPAPARESEEEKTREKPAPVETALEATEAAARALTVPALADVPEGPAGVVGPLVRPSRPLSGSERRDGTDIDSSGRTVPPHSESSQGAAPISASATPTVLSAAPRRTGAVGRPPVQKDREQMQLASTTKSVRVAAAVHKKLMHAALDLDIDFSLLVNRILSDWSRKHSRREAQLPPPLA